MYVHTYMCVCVRAHTHTLIANVRWDVYGVHIGHISDPPYMGQMSNVGHIAGCRRRGPEGHRVCVYIWPKLSVRRCSLEAASHLSGIYICPILSVRRCSLEAASHSSYEGHHGRRDIENPFYIDNTFYIYTRTHSI
jgi:hypothetical protein